MKLSTTKHVTKKGVVKSNPSKQLGSFPNGWTLLGKGGLTTTSSRDDLNWKNKQTGAIIILSPGMNASYLGEHHWISYLVEISNTDGKVLQEDFTTRNTALAYIERFMRLHKEL